MYVNLKDLKPNPFRDYHVDPIDAHRVNMLAKSIKENGFWGGVVLRKKNGAIEIGAGHHRIAAAIKAGETKADLFVGDFSDDAMAVVYATENATHRGGSGTAGAGSIAAAVRLLARKMIAGSSSGIPEDRFSREFAHGIGEAAVFSVLKSVPHFSSEMCKGHLAAIKASGDYHRIVGEVAAEVEAVMKAEIAKAAKAKKEAEEAQRKADDAKRLAEEAAARKKQADADNKAAKEEAAKKQAEANAKKAEQEKKEADLRKQAADKMVAEADSALAKMAGVLNAADQIEKAKADEKSHVATFDFEGVAEVLDNEHQLETFRQVVTKPENLERLPVKKQAAYAKWLKAKAEGGRKFLWKGVTDFPGGSTSDLDDGLTARYIRQNGGWFISQAWQDAVREERKIVAIHKAKTEKANAEVFITNKLLDVQRHLNNAANSLFAAKQKAKDNGIKRYTFPVGFHTVLDDWIKEAQQMKRGIV